MKYHSFNVHANFQPNIQTLAPGGPTSLVSIDGAQQESRNTPGVQQSGTLFPPFEFSKHCNCRSRHVEVFNIPPGQEGTVLNLIQHCGATEARPVYNASDNTVTASYFDDRSAAKLVHFISLNSSSSHPRISVRKLLSDDEDSILLNSPWGIATTPHELEKHMAQYGDIEHSTIEPSINGGITRAQFLYHDYRDALKVANSNITCHDTKMIVQLARYPHSFICQMKDLQLNASPSYLEIRAPCVTQSKSMVNRKMSATGQNQSFLQSSLSRPHLAQQLPIGVSPFQDRHFRKTNSPCQRDLQEHDSAHLPLTPLDDHFDASATKLPYQGISPASSPYIAPIGTGSSERHNSSTSSMSSNSLSGAPRSRALGSFSSIDSMSSLSPTCTTDKLEVSEHESCLDALKKFNASNQVESPQGIDEKLSPLLPSASQLQSPREIPVPVVRPQCASQPKKDSTTINLQAIDAGIETRTTVMVRNIPNKLEFDDFKRFVDQTSQGTYEFLYLRFDFCNRCNVGYAFISFAKPEHVKAFVQSRTGMKWSQYNYNSEKVIEIRFARIQGCENLIQKFRNSPVMHQESAFRPKLYYASGDLIGKEKPFPESIP